MRVSRHWKPEGEATPARAPRECARPAKRPPLPPGALAGLIMVAAACAGAVLALNWAFGRSDVFADAPPPDAPEWDAVGPGPR